MGRGRFFRMRRGGFRLSQAREHLQAFHTDHHFTLKDLVAGRIAAGLEDQPLLTTLMRAPDQLAAAVATGWASSKLTLNKDRTLNVQMLRLVLLHPLWACAN